MRTANAEAGEAAVTALTVRVPAGSRVTLVMLTGLVPATGIPCNVYDPGIVNRLEVIEAPMTTVDAFGSITVAGNPPSFSTVKPKT